MLRDVFKIPKHLQDATISRLEIISGMDISDRRRRQDGRNQLRFEGKRIDLRVSTLPTQFGEKVVIRLLDQQRAVMLMDKIDLTPENLRVLQLLLLRPQGMILVRYSQIQWKGASLSHSWRCVNGGIKVPKRNDDPDIR